MGKIYEVKRYCPDCGEWRTIKAAQKSERDPVVKCRAHMKRRPRSGKPTRAVTGYLVMKTDRGLEYEHRLVWERAHGPIPPGYHVHHVNGQRDDNRLENLELVLGIRHNREHTTERHQSRELDTRGARSVRWRADLNTDYIVRRRSEGASFRQIGREVGAGHNTVSHHYRLAVGDQGA